MNWIIPTSVYTLRQLNLSHIWTNFYCLISNNKKLDYICVHTCAPVCELKWSNWNHSFHTHMTFKMSGSPQWKSLLSDGGHIKASIPLHNRRRWCRSEPCMWKHDHHPVFNYIQDRPGQQLTSVKIMRQRCRAASQIVGFLDLLLIPLWWEGHRSKSDRAAIELMPWSRTLSRCR